MEISKIHLRYTTKLPSTELSWMSRRPNKADIFSFKYYINFKIMYSNARHIFVIHILYKHGLYLTYKNTMKETICRCTVRNEFSSL